MNIFESNFMRRARYLPEEKKVFLLDTMDSVRNAFLGINDTWNRDQFYNNNFSPLKRQSAIMWMLFDHPKYRDVQLIEQRLEEMKNLMTNHRVNGWYTATGVRLMQNRWGEVRVVAIDGPLGEPDFMPQEKRAEYEERMREYIALDDAGRERFISEIKNPLNPYNINYIKMAQQRAF